jgi:hypothetical protein
MWVDPWGLYSDLLSRGMGHHLMPMSIERKLGLSQFSAKKSIAWYPNVSKGTASLHGKLHSELINQGVPFHGSKYTGTVDDFFESGAKAYAGYDVKGYMKIPGTEEKIYKNVTLSEGLEKLKQSLTPNPEGASVNQKPIGSC